jgi:hypothetical protein
MLHFRTKKLNFSLFPKAAEEDLVLQLTFFFYHSTSPCPIKNVLHKMSDSAPQMKPKSKAVFFWEAKLALPVPLPFRLVAYHSTTALGLFAAARGASPAHGPPLPT